MRTVCGGFAPGDRRWRGSLELEGAGNALRCRLLRAAWAVAGLVALLAVLVLAVLVAVDAHADRRRQWTTYGSDRGRLVVACDMRSSTCSDGRRITTTRSTPVPCETAPGVWEMVPEDTACISYRGLESWAANTSYLSWGAELDRSPWQAVEGASIDGRILTGPVGSARLIQSGLSVSTGPHTLACRMRALSGNSVRLRVFADGGTGHTIAAKSVGPEWATVFHTWKIGGEPTSLSAHIYPDGSTLEIAGCWLTRTSTPGRACWGGEAPVTCAADRHIVSTEGWPTEAGEISMVVELNEPLSEGRNAWLFDGRDAGTSGGVNPYIQPDGRLRFRVGGVVHGFSSPMLTWEVGRPYLLQFRRKDGLTSVYRDGARLYEVATSSWEWAPNAHLGMNFSFTGPETAMAIRSLRVRSFE